MKNELHIRDLMVILLTRSCPPHFVKLLFQPERGSKTIHFFMVTDGYSFQSYFTFLIMTRASTLTRFRVIVRNGFYEVRVGSKLTPKMNSAYSSELYLPEVTYTHEKILTSVTTKRELSSRN